MADEVHSSPFPLDRWLKLAEIKLKSGYVLLMDTNRRSAKFFKRGFGFEPCPYQAAQFLVESGRLVKAKKNKRETTYQLADGKTLVAPEEVRKKTEDEEIEDVDFSSGEEDAIDETDFDDETLEEEVEDDD